VFRKEFTERNCGLSYTSLKLDAKLLIEQKINILLDVDVMHYIRD